MKKYKNVKDSGKRFHYQTGAQRDTDDDKPRYELLPVLPLMRVAHHYGLGAKKYDDDNWRKGFPWRRVLGSLYRHAFAFARGEDDEDHLAAVVFNAMALMEYQEKHPELNDLPEHGKGVYGSSTRRRPRAKKQKG